MRSLAFWLAIALAFLTGCRGSVHPVGKIGDYQVYSVKLPSAAGPSLNLAVFMRGTNTQPQVVAVSAGNGLGPSVLNSAGLVGAAAALEPNKVNTVTTTTTAAPATSGTVGPQLPLNYVPPYKWGPNKP